MHTMSRPLRSLALPALAAIALTGCTALPFEIVPKAPPGESETTEVISEPAPTAEAATAEATTEEAAEETIPPDTDGDGQPNYNVTPEEALAKVVELCSLPADVLYDDGMTLILDTPGTDPNTGTMTIEEAGCAVKKLNPPQWLREQMFATTVSDGRMTATAGYVTYSWKVTNEAGLDFIITVSPDEA